jgi:hypothetical protein
MAVQLPELPEGGYSIMGLDLDGFFPVTIVLPERRVSGYYNEMQSCGCCTEPVDCVKEWDDLWEEHQEEIAEEMFSRIQTK